MSISSNIFTFITITWYAFYGTAAFGGSFKFVQSKGGKIVEVAEASVKSTCGKDFIFREEGIDEIPKYLKKDAVLATFGGKLVPNLVAIKEELDSSDGTCAWVTAEEFGQIAN